MGTKSNNNENERKYFKIEMEKGMIFICLFINAIHN